MDEMVTSNGNVSVWLVPANGIADYRSPTPEEINAGLNVTPSIAWESTTFPTASESEDVDDRSLLDRGNATGRGAAQFEAALNFFYPNDLLDNTSDYGKTYNLLRVPRVPLYVVTRVLQGTTGVMTPAKAGDWISVYRFITDGWSDDIEGDDSYKYAIGFLTQGEVAIYTQVKNEDPIVVVNESGETSLTVGDTAVLTAKMGGKDATHTVDWRSSDLAVASVSQNGIVKAISTGSASITATHPAATDGTPISITVA